MDPVAASFFGTVIGSFLYGIFFILAISSTVLHVKREARAHRRSFQSRADTFASVVRNPMIMAGLALFLTVTAVRIS
jgi:cytochrome bd-type quinol oxidase subunit 1